ncbi:MAG: DUF547 domain-containing protein [Myxococcota bacterium]
MATSTAGSWFRRSVWLAVAALVAGSGVALYVDGRLPAAVPADAPVYRLVDLSRALEAVNASGEVNLGELKARHESLERFVASLAATAPATKPDQFPTPEDKVAYWLNAYHALVLVELLDVRGTAAGQLSSVGRSWPIGGERLTKRAILRRFLEATGDGRVPLTLFTGARGHGVLDGAPFDAQTLDAQLDDAMRRFMRRKENVVIDGKTVRVSALLEQHEAELLAALPPDRHGLMQIVWAYLPESCDGLRPGCPTRGELDRACGARLDQCAVEWVAVDETLAVVP